MKKIILVVLILVVVAGVAWFVVQRMVRDGDVLLKANADDLKTTVVTPHLEAPIEEGKNVLWCATFQLAWNEACDLVGEDIHLDNEPAMVAVLNKHAATKADVDEASCVALAGRTNEGIAQKIRQAVRTKFGEDVPTPLADLPADPDMLVAYAMLVKTLEFETPFEPLDDGELEFRGTPVRAFGLTGGGQKMGTGDLMKQVVHYAEDDVDAEGIYELLTKETDDHLVLAIVQPGATLAETVADVQARMAKARRTECHSDTIKVPKLNFDILKNYAELLDKRMNVKDPRANQAPIVLALQTIRFQLNEYGAKLRSEAMVKAVESAPMPAPPVFNKSFLIMLQRTDAKTPYFALWVDNVELLMPIR